jgi:uncharacterized membrane protein
MSLLRFEHRSEPVAPRRVFLRRLAANGLVALTLILVSLAAGTLGYYASTDLDWLGAFDQAAMIIGGMGAYDQPDSTAGKIFSGLFALYAGVLLILVTGLILAPVLHRVLHHFHLSGGAEGEVSRRQSIAGRQPNVSRRHEAAFTLARSKDEIQQQDHDEGNAH